MQGNQRAETDKSDNDASSSSTTGATNTNEKEKATTEKKKLESKSKGAQGGWFSSIKSIASIFGSRSGDTGRQSMVRKCTKQIWNRVKSNRSLSTEMGLARRRERGGRCGIETSAHDDED